MCATAPTDCSDVIKLVPMNQGSARGASRHIHQHQYGNEASLSAAQTEGLMTTQTDQSPSPLIWIASMAIVLFSGVGIAAFMGWLPTSFGSESNESVVVVAPAQPVHKTNMQVAANNQSKATCNECGVVESVRVINSAGNTSGVGLVGGAVIGGLLGNQVGGGRGKDVATVAGAVGGAVAGNAIEKNAGTTRSYEITIHFEDGSRRVFNEANPPAWKSGDHVRVVDGTIQPNG